MSVMNMDWSNPPTTLTKTLHTQFLIHKLCFPDLPLAPSLFPNLRHPTKTPSRCQPHFNKILLPMIKKKKIQNPTSILFLPPHPSLLLSIRFLLFSVLLIARSGPLALQSATAAAGLVQPGLYTSKYWINGIRFYSSAFQDFIAGGYLSPESKALCVETPTGRDVFALREIGEAAREVWPRRADSFRGRNLRFRVLRRGLVRAVGEAGRVRG